MSVAAVETFGAAAEVLPAATDKCPSASNQVSSLLPSNNDCAENKNEKSAKARASAERTDNKESNNPKSLIRRGSSSFIRAHDLDVPEELQQGGTDVLSSVLHDSMRCQGGRRGPDRSATESMFFVDQDLKLVLDQLVQLGFSEATDESTRFAPGRETANILRRREKQHQQPSSTLDAEDEWPVGPWHAASQDNLKEILIWNGVVNNHKGFGHDWPIVKARGLIPASPRTVLEFLWDSKNLPKYNSMSQGRYDGTVFQEGFDTLAEDSPLGFPGCAKIFKSYNKVKLVPRIIELVSLFHARPLGPPLAAPGTYLIVSRSIWESDDDNSEGPDDDNNNTETNVGKNGGAKLVRSEMLLGVQLLRPISGGTSCELTTVTHALVPGMNNKTMAKAAANVSAAKILRDIQASLLN